MGSAGANAACTTTGNVVTCADANTANQVNAAINSVAPPSVSLVIAPGATVTRQFSSGIFPNGNRFTNAVEYNNAGTVGTTAANVDFNYFGAIGVAANSFSFNNSGTQNGGIFAQNIGGAIMGVNSGTVTRGIDLHGAGPISLTSSGPVYNTNNFFGFNSGITLISSRTASVLGADNVRRNTETGGPVTVVITGPVAAPAGTQFAGPQDVFVRSVAGADVRIDNVARNISVLTRGDNVGETSFTSRSTSTNTGFTFESTDSANQRTIGGDARGTIGVNGQVASLFVQSGLGTATAMIAGTVGNPASQGGVTAEASGSTNLFSSASAFTFNFNTGVSTQSSTSSQAVTRIGGSAAIEVASTGRVLGSLTASSDAGGATIRIAGQAGNNNFFESVQARSTGANFNQSGRFESRADGSSNSNSASSETASGGAASIVVEAGGNVLGSTRATGDASASTDSAGRVRGSVGASSNRFQSTASASEASRTETTGAGGSRTVVERNAFNNRNDDVGGTATLVNQAGAIIEGGANATGVRGASINNSGAIFGGVSLTSTGATRTNVGNNLTTSTFAPGGFQPTSSVRESTNMNSARATGGAVTGTYGGTVGAVQGSGLETFTQVNQFANTTSAATVTGTLFADFNGTAASQNSTGSSTSSTRQTSQPATFPATGASTRSESGTSANSATQNLSTSSLTVASTGRILANGRSGGTVNINSAGGNADLTVNGGRVDGAVSVNAGTGANSEGSSTSAQSFSRAANPNGFFQFVPEILESATSSNTSDRRAARAAATATIAGGTLGGNLLVRGTGTGTLGAVVTANGNIAGSLTVRGSGIDSRNASTKTTTRTAPGAFTRTTTNSFASAPSAANDGGLLVNVGAGIGGSIDASTGVGPATVNITGRVGTAPPQNIFVVSSGTSTQSTSTETRTGANEYNIGALTAAGSTSSSVATGGVATLNVAANAATQAADSSVEGNIFVRGLGGSVFNNAAGSRILTTARADEAGNVSNGNFISIGQTFFNIVATNETTAGGATQSDNVRRTAVGSPATLTNAGSIGSATNAVSVNVFSPNSAMATNTGTINGSVFAIARTANTNSTTVVTNANDPVLRRIVTTTVSTPVGGATQITNSGLVTGLVQVGGSTGAITNSGVVRGTAFLGLGFANFTTVNTATATSNVTATPVVPATLFQQNYTLDQGGLLIGGVSVQGANFIGLTEAPLRTGNVNATVNLNNGSVTLGNIAAEQTNTNVNLNGSGFLGVASNDVPTGTAAPGTTAAFQSTPNLARFSAIDPAVGTAAVPLTSGSRVSGVQTLTKAGDGTFVIVGAPVQTIGAAAPTQTLDVATLRTTGGELQLGLAAPATATSVFGVRGNVENNAALVIGHRVVGEQAQAIQGINLAVGGNLTNAASGNLIVGVNPTLVRQNGAALVPTSPDPFGFGPATVGLSPFVPFGQQTPGLTSTNSFVRVDGNLTQAGTVTVQAVTGGIYEAGRAYDLFNVGGTFSNTGRVQSNLASPFISFSLTPRSEGGRTIVSLGVNRVNFDTVAADRNSAAAANALQLAIPRVVRGIRAGAGATADFAAVQDLATVISALDTRLTAAQATQAFRELSSGEFYGSLGAVSTTATFGEATDGLLSADAAPGTGLWFRPTGEFAKFDANDDAGASGIQSDNYGGSIGLNYASGAEGTFGVAVGYSRIDVNASGTPERAEGDTYMVGAYGARLPRGMPGKARACTATGAYPGAPSIRFGGQAGVCVGQ